MTQLISVYYLTYFWLEFPVKHSPYHFMICYETYWESEDSDKEPLSLNIVEPDILPAEIMEDTKYFLLSPLKVFRFTLNVVVFFNSFVALFSYLFFIFCCCCYFLCYYCCWCYCCCCCCCCCCCFAVVLLLMLLLLLLLLLLLFCCCFCCCCCCWCCCCCFCCCCCCYCCWCCCCCFYFILCFFGFSGYRLSTELTTKWPHPWDGRNYQG